MVRPNRVLKVWERLDVPASLVKMTNELHLTKKERVQAFVDLYLNSYPHKLSWKDIARELYHCGEMSAAREAKKFYHQSGK